MKTEDEVDLKNLFEETCKNFESRGVKLFRDGRTVVPKRIYPIDSHASKLLEYWTFEIYLLDDMLYWNIEPHWTNIRDHLENVIVMKTYEKFRRLDGWVKKDGLYYKEGYSTDGEKMGELDIPKMFFSVSEFYYKVYWKAYQEKERLLKDAENKFKKYLAKFF